MHTFLATGSKVTNKYKTRLAQHTHTHSQLGAAELDGPQSQGGPSAVALEGCLPHLLLYAPPTEGAF